MLVLSFGSTATSKGHRRHCIKPTGHLQVGHLQVGQTLPRHLLVILASDPWMSADFVECRSLLWVYLENMRHQAQRGIRALRLDVPLACAYLVPEPCLLLVSLHACTGKSGTDRWAIDYWHLGQEARHSSGGNLAARLAASWASRGHRAVQRSQGR